MYVRCTALASSMLNVNCGFIRWFLPRVRPKMLIAFWHWRTKRSFSSWNMPLGNVIVRLWISRVRAESSVRLRYPGELM